MRNFEVTSGEIPKVFQKKLQKIIRRNSRRIFREESSTTSGSIPEEIPQAFVRNL